jgi:cell division transport system permease protein
MYRFYYFIKQALQNMRAAVFVNAITIGTIALALVIFSTYLLIYSNLGRLLGEWQKRIGATVYLVDGLDKGPIAELEARIGAVEGVRKIRFTTAEQALEKFRVQLGDDADLLDGLDANPLPDSFDIMPTPDYFDHEKITEMSEEISSFPGVEEVEYGREWIDKFSDVMNLLQAAGLILGGLLLLAGLLIISNTIKLTVFARKDEIDIMRLVGATNTFIKLPFLIEGLLQGLAGALVALAATLLVYQFLLSGIDINLGLSFEPIRMEFLDSATMLTIFIGGAAIGVIGSALALGRFLKV